MRIDRRITHQPRSSFLLAIVALGIAAALAAALFLLPIQTYFNQDTQLDLRRDQLAKLEAVNDDLRLEVARLETDEGVREAAREELCYVQAGEHRESMPALPDVPTILPDGWPYSLVTSIVALRTGPVQAPRP